MPTPKKYSEYTPTANPDGSEVIPFGKSGSNGTLVLSTISKRSRTTVTVGKTGSGADFECDGVDDHIQINAAITLAATSLNIATVEIIGYSATFQYSIGAPIVLKPTVAGQAVNIVGSNTYLKAQTGYSGDVIITQNFFAEINTNHNSYSTIGQGKITGIRIEGNSAGGVVHTITYVNLAAFPATGDSSKMYIARDTDTGYLWNGTAYTTTGIADTGKHWRAYAHHLIKIYGFNYILEDIRLSDALEFAFYSEQTNTDTNVFNNYETMEATIRRLHIVGYNLGGINWCGPHDSAWEDVKVHTNEYATNALYNIHSSNGTNFNGGGLVWRDVHPWGPTASYGSNVVLVNTSVRGDAYIEGSSNIGLNATGSTVQLDLVTTNNTIGVQLTNCYNTALRITNYYQFNTIVNLVKLIGTLTGSQIYVMNVDTNNLSGTPKVFDITGLTTATNNLLWARIPHASPVISSGIAISDLDATNEIDIVKAGSTAAGIVVTKRLIESSANIPAAKTANYVLLQTDKTVVFDATAASRTGTLPSAVTYSGPGIFIKRVDATYAAGNTVTIATTASQTIDGASTQTLSTNYSGYLLQTNGANWLIIGKV